MSEILKNNNGGVNENTGWENMESKNFDKDNTSEILPDGEAREMWQEMSSEERKTEYNDLINILKKDNAAYDSGRENGKRVYGLIEFADNLFEHDNVEKVEGYDYKKDKIIYDYFEDYNQSNHDMDGRINVWDMQHTDGVSMSEPDEYGDVYVSMWSEDAEIGYAELKENEDSRNEIVHEEDYDDEEITSSHSETIKMPFMSFQNIIENHYGLDALAGSGDRELAEEYSKTHPIHSRD